jgi:uncharacterized repeat protein (TIGR03806 family)
MRARLSATLLCAALLALSAASAQAPPPGVEARSIMAAAPARTLAAYRFFTDAGARAPNAGVTPYDLNTPLYSDGALKYRYVYIPPGAAAQYSDADVFAFPVGAVLIKTFAFAADMRAPERNVRFLETRLLIRQPDGWVARAYVWNEAQTEAVYSPIGAQLPTSFTDANGQSVALDWAVPNQNQCKGCHDHAGAITPIGPSARNLNRDYGYADGAANQLAYWSARGLLAAAPAPDAAPRAADAYDAASGPLNARARAYLDVNCGHCHNPDGPAHTSGLDLRSRVAAPIAWGVLKRPVAAGRASADFTYDIEPGHPERSILLHRMESTDPGVMMPELGRQRVDTRAVALMRDWIAGMDADGGARN